MRERGIEVEIPNFPEWLETSHIKGGCGIFIPGFWTLSGNYIFQYSEKNQVIYYRKAIEYLQRTNSDEYKYIFIPVKNFDFNVDPCIYIMETML